MTHCVRWGPWPHGKRRFGGWTPSQNMQLQSVLCSHLVNTNEEIRGLATAIPPFAELLGRCWRCCEDWVRKLSSCVAGMAVDWGWQSEARRVVLGLVRLSARQRCPLAALHATQLTAGLLLGWNFHSLLYNTIQYSFIAVADRPLRKWHTQWHVGLW